MHRFTRWTICTLGLCVALLAAPTAPASAVALPTPHDSEPTAQPGWDSPDDAPVVNAIPWVDVKASIIISPRDLEIDTVIGSTSTSSTSTSTLPFDYTAIWDAKLRGRDMQTYNGVFCNLYRAKDVENWGEDPYTDIQLSYNANNARDKHYTKVRYPNDGEWWKYCWQGHSNHLTYYFTYAQADNEHQVIAEGRVDGK